MRGGGKEPPTAEPVPEQSCFFGCLLMTSALSLPVDHVRSSEIQIDADTASGSRPMSIEESVDDRGEVTPSRGPGSRRTARCAAAGERGVMMVETAVISPFLILLLFVVVDVGGMLCDYMTLSHITGVALRYGVARPALEPGTFTSTYPLVAGTVPLQHRNIHNRIFRLCQLYGIEQSFDGDEIRITTIYQPVNTLTVSPDEDTVTVRIEGINYRSFFNFFGLFSLRVTEQGGYLFFTPE